VAGELSRLRSPAAVQAALDEFASLGRSAFLARYGFGRSREFLVRNPANGELCDSKAIVGAAFGFEYPDEGALTPADFSGGEATVAPKLQALGFEVIRVGEDWTAAEVDATVASYFGMLKREARQERYVKAEFNAELRESLRGRSKGSVELKYANVSSVLDTLGLPFVRGYKPRSNVQLRLRQAVQQYVQDHTALVQDIVDAMEEVKAPAERQFKAVVVEPPTLEPVIKTEGTGKRTRLPRKTDFAQRDEANRRLGRAGEQWALGFEHRRLVDAGLADLVQRVDWVSERLGDGAGYDILSFESGERHRFIEVKTTNGAHGTAFIVSRNELDFALEAGDEFYLYRLFRFREAPALYILRGDISKHVHLEALDYRASFRRLLV